MLTKLGSKTLHTAEKFGQKSIHIASKFGAKGLPIGAAVASAAMPELSIPLAIGAELAKPVLKTIQKASR